MIIWIFPKCYWALSFVTSRIKSTIFSICDTRDSWLELTEIVLVLICFANCCCATGGILWLHSEFWYHRGTSFQAGVPTDDISHLSVIHNFVMLNSITNSPALHCCKNSSRSNLSCIKRVTSKWQVIFFRYFDLFMTIM